MAKTTKHGPTESTPQDLIAAFFEPDRQHLAAVRAANEIAAAAGRRVDTPVRRTFVRNLNDEDPARPPMTRIYVGGRSGTVALKLYLALIWRCAKPPYSTAIPARAWATLLGLPDPETKGARRVAAALKRLEEGRFVVVTPQPGAPNLVTLLEESGEGRAYEVPSTAYARAERTPLPPEQIYRHRYFKVGSKLWLSGKIQGLSGPGLVMLLILLAERGGEGRPVWFSTSAFHDRYRISQQTRAAGTSELMTAGLLSIEKKSLAADPRSTTLDPRRSRSVYRLFGEALVRD